MNVSNKIKNFVFKYPKMSSLGFSLLTPALIIGSVNGFKLLTHVEHLSSIGSNIAVTMVIGSFLAGMINLLGEGLYAMDNDGDRAPLKNIMKKSIKKNLESSMHKYNNKVFQLDKDDVIPYNQKELTYQLKNLVNFIYNSVYDDGYANQSDLNELRNLSISKKEIDQKKWKYYKNFALEYLEGFPIVSNAITNKMDSENVLFLFELMDKKLTQEDKKELSKIKNKNYAYFDMIENGPIEFFSQLPSSLKKQILNESSLSKDRHNELNQKYKENKNLAKNQEKKEDVFFETKKETFVNYETPETNKYLNYLKEKEFEQNYHTNAKQIKMILNVKEAALAILLENNISLIEEELFLKNDIDKFFIHLSDELKLFNKIERIERAKGKSEEELTEKKHELLNNHSEIIHQLAQKVLNVSDTIENKLTQDLESKKEVNRQFLSQKLG